MNSTSQQTALITGASGGIGYEFARVLARNGYNLVLVARSEDKLKQLAVDLENNQGITAKVIAQDLATPTAPDELYQTLQNEGVTIDILINNAGFATYGHFVELDLQRELQMMQLNMMTLTHLTGLFGRAMVARKRGKILNVASTAAFQPGPLMAVYYATKAYVLSFSEALANELQGTGVTVTALCPGPTESGFQARASMEDSKLVSGGGLMTSDEVAEVGYQGLMTNKTVVIPGFKNRMLALTPRFLPRNLVTQTVRTMQERGNGH